MNVRSTLRVIFIGYFTGPFELSSNTLPADVHFVFFGGCKLTKIIYFGNA